MPDLPRLDLLCYNTTPLTQEIQWKRCALNAAARTATAKPGQIDLARVIRGAENAKLRPGRNGDRKIEAIT
jgi:hypothetical protein